MFITVRFAGFGTIFAIYLMKSQVGVSTFKPLKTKVMNLFMAKD